MKRVKKMAPSPSANRHRETGLLGPDEAWAAKVAAALA